MNVFYSLWMRLFSKTQIQKETEKLPYGHIIEGPMTIQCLCPVCPYAQGYNEPFLASYYEHIEVVCQTCKTRFIGLS